MASRGGDGPEREANGEPSEHQGRGNDQGGPDGEQAQPGQQGAFMLGQSEDAHQQRAHGQVLDQQDRERRPSEAAGDHTPFGEEAQNDRR